MSSILKALKKVETESHDRGDFRPGLAVKRTKTTARHRVSGSRYFYMGILAVFLLLILGGGTWFFFGRPPRGQSLEPVENKDIKPFKSAGLDAKKAISRVTPHKKGIATQIARPTESLDKTTVPTVSPQHAPLAKLAPKIKKPISAPERKAVLPDTTPETPASATVIEPVEKPPASRSEKKVRSDTPLGIPDKQAPVSDIIQKKPLALSDIERSVPRETKDRFASMPVKSEDTSGLKLQAIAWSEDPKHRMAVINNNIVREGGSVEGAAVTHIGEDMVVFKKEGEEWKQLFRLR